MIPYGRQCIDDTDIAAVLEVLHSDWLTQGPAIPRFEAAVANTCGVRHAVAVCNATSALHLACLALDVGPGDIVWTSPNTFVASANCARYCGAEVDFIDIDPDTLNLSVEKLAIKLAQAKAKGRLPKVLIPVHFAGQPCDMATISYLAKEYGCRIIEDASHAIGARYRGIPIGACAHSDITVFSFHPVKIITSGEGGMAVTNDPALATRIALLRSHGTTRDPALMVGESEGPWHYQQIALGYNYRITDLQAALGASQLQRLPSFVARRAALAERYRKTLAHLPIGIPTQAEGCTSAWHLFVIRVASEKRREMFVRLRAAGVGVNVHYIPVHLQPDYRLLGYAPGDFPEAEQYYREAITLPLYFGLTEEEQDYVALTLSDVLQ
ncbi:UDP-4-amino-4-deoxy-L-arabinose--oxoglutarate aminotransferase [mine drainage metagenome]|uniref:UDP-4-amino-4-deoxy-L-arabinose--oxoglutarate aminotransferase n=1 Tax=mine drainage metagenome TaxID=410659 RepID=A0A1J5RFE2_9ZZZZ